MPADAARAFKCRCMQFIRHIAYLYHHTHALSTCISGINIELRRGRAHRAAARADAGGERGRHE
ncbi:MAG: hypothetical protein ACREE3_13810, partial [Stellaceae bacterium]